MEVTAKTVLVEVLSVLRARKVPSVPVRLLLRACAALDISENSARVALVRLQDEGLVDSKKRGHYKLGRAARPLSEQVMAWQTVGDRMCAWDGSFIGVMTAHLSRSDRPALAKRTRALRLFGFEELNEDLYVRPNNLKGGVAEVRKQLFGLGLERHAVVMRIDELSRGDLARARNLWDANEIIAGYRSLHKRLAVSSKRLSKQPFDKAIKEAFLLGRETIRFIVLDPLLPEAMVPRKERDCVVKAMSRYNELGIGMWERYLDPAQGVAA